MFGLVLVTAYDEHEAGMLCPEFRDLQVGPQVKMGEPDDQVGARVFECPDNTPRMSEVVRLRWHVVTIVTAVLRVQQQREDAHLVAIGFEHEGALQ